MIKHTAFKTTPRLAGRLRIGETRRIAAGVLRIAVVSTLTMIATGATASDHNSNSQVANAAKSVLGQHCARCHDVSQLKEGLDRPKGKFGFVLDLNRVVSKRLVIPGNSSGSTLMRQIENGSMPKDMSADCYLFPTPEDAYCGPSAEDVATLRSWIDSLENPDLTLAEATIPDADASAAGTESQPVDTPVTRQPETTQVAPDVATEPAPETAAETAETDAAETSLADTIAELVAEDTPEATPPPAVEESTAESTSPPEAAPSLAEVTPRGFIRDEEIIKAMALDLAEVPEARRKNMRYLTLTHLYNAGDEEEALDVYRMAIAKLLNSLSRKSDPVIPIAIDEARTVLRFDIQDLGWAASLWETVAKANPYFVQYDDALYTSLQGNTGTKMPFVRADWFAFVGSQPPLYHDLLGLPDNKQEFEKMLGVDVLANIDSLDVARAGFRHSGVSTNNRLIERHQMPTGAYWESYDFAGNAGRQDFFTHPLGPTTAYKDTGLGEKHGFVHDGGEVIFTLPNGFHAYYLTTGKGERIDRGPTTIVRDDSRRDAAVTNGISCMGCHEQGVKFNPHRPLKAHDEIRDVVLANITNPKEMRDTVEEIFPPHETFYALMQKDAEDYERALSKAGINMRTKYDGLEMVNALFARFEEDVTADLAAAEFGLTKEEFFLRLGMAGGSAYTVKIRFTQDRIPRDQFVKTYSELANKITDNSAISLAEATQAASGTVSVSEARPAEASKTFDLEFVPTTEKYLIGDTVTFTVKSAKPCYLTLVNVDDKDRVQVVFPNKFNQDNEIEPGRGYTIPSDEIGGFKFLFAEPGKEKVIAICNASRSTPRGITHAFDNEDYTTFRSIGDLTKSRLISVESDQGAKGTSQALVENTIDPKVDIVAQKAIVLSVVAK